MEIGEYIVATDQQLVKLCLDGGDAVAFEHLFNRYKEAILQFYMTRTGGNGDDSDDLLQETFVKVFLNIHRYNDNYTFGQWIYTIARNTFVDYYRRRRGDIVPIDNTTESIAGMAVLGGPNPEESLIKDQNRAELDEMMNRLTPKYRVLIELRFLREFSYEEIAAELRLPLGTVKTQIHRARERLCRLIISNDEKMR